MGYFDFLNGPDEGADTAQTVEGPSLSAPSIASGSPVLGFQQKRGALKDQALLKALGVKDKLQEKLYREGPYQTDNQFEVDQVGKDIEEKLRQADPSDYSKILEEHGADNSIRGDLDSIVSQYKRLQVSPEAASVRQQGVSQDVPGIVKRISDLEAKKTQLYDDKKFAASKGHEEEIQKSINFLGGLQDDLKKRLQALSPPEPLSTAPAVIPSPTPSLKETAHAAGTNYPEMISYLAKYSSILSAGGWAMNAPIGNGGFPVTFVSLAKALGDPGLYLLSNMSRTAEAIPSPDGTTKKPDELTPVEKIIQDRQKRQEEIYGELKNSGAFKSVGDVLVHVLFSLLIGPQAAAKIFSDKSRQGELRGELDNIQQDLHLYFQERASQQRLSEEARHNAAMEEYHRRQLEEQQYKDEAYLRLRQALPKGKDQEYDAVLSGIRTLKGKWDRYTKVIDNSINEDEADVTAAKAARKQIEAELTQAEGYAQKILNRKIQEAHQNAVPTGFAGTR